MSKLDTAEEELLVLTACQASNVVDQVPKLVDCYCPANVQPNAPPHYRQLPCVVIPHCNASATENDKIISNDAFLVSTRILQCCEYAAEHT